MRAAADSAPCRAHPGRSTRDGGGAHGRRRPPRRGGGPRRPADLDLPRRALDRTALRGRRRRLDGGRGRDPHDAVATRRGRAAPSSARARSRACALLDRRSASAGRRRSCARRCVIAIASELVAVAALAPLALPAPRPAATAITARGLAAAGLLAIAALHVAAAGEEWADNRTIFWLFMALAAACAALALRLAQGAGPPHVGVRVAARRRAAGRLPPEPHDRTARRPRTTSATGATRSGSRHSRSRPPCLPLAVTRLRTSSGPERTPVSPFVVSAPGPRVGTP